MVFSEFETEKDKVGVTTMKESAAAMMGAGAQRAILVLQKPPTSFAKQFLDQMDKKYRVDVFQVFLSQFSSLVIVLAHMNIITTVPRTCDCVYSLMEKSKQFLISSKSPSRGLARCIRWIQANFLFTEVTLC